MKRTDSLDGWHADSSDFVNLFVFASVHHSKSQGHLLDISRDMSPHSSYIGTCCNAITDRYNQTTKQKNVKVSIDMKTAEMESHPSNGCSWSYVIYLHMYMSNRRLTPLV
jgi:hypothetical protein